MNRNEDAAIIEHRLGFGRAVQTLRKHRNLSQEALALTASIDRSYMGRIERGEQSISLDKIWAICDALEISILELFQTALIEERHLKQQRTTPTA